MLRRISSSAILLAASLAFAEPGPPADHCSAPSGLSTERFAKPIALVPGAGRLHQAVSSDVAEAQAYYDQGFAYLASYVWVDAARSFHEALRRDSGLALAELGLAKAHWNSSDLPSARSHLARAARLAEAQRVSEKERRWVALFAEQLAALAAPSEQAGALHDAYKRSIERLIALDPSDANAWWLRGNAEEPGAWGRGQRGEIRSIAFYDAALLRDPANLAAQHFLVHSYENVALYEQAAVHGRAYAAAAPAVAHAQHMYGHVLPRLGRWREARAQFEAADRIERAYYAEQAIPPQDDWHHGHNLSVLGVVALRLGDVADAEERLREAFELRVASGLNCSAWIEYLLYRERFPDALEAAQTCEATGSANARMVGASLAAEALAALGKPAAADAALARARAAHVEAVEEAKATPYAAFAARLERALDFSATVVALHGAQQADAEASMIRLADETAALNSIDGWAAGLYRLARVRALAERLGRARLSAEIAERIARIDPAFESAEVAAAPPQRLDREDPK